MLGDRIPASFRTVPILLGVLAVALIDKQAFYFVYLAVLPPIVINLAYAPGERLLRFNNLGDYSYGLYIYAFPIQQTLAAVDPGQSWLTLTLTSGTLTLGLAILSWRYVERPALARKEACAAATLRWFASLRARVARFTWPTAAPAAHGRRPEAR
jgi:peptidoglycan/LPS O-acetylase OafA/YrhL